MCEKTALSRLDRTTEEGARDYVRAIAIEAVALKQVEAKTKEVAVHAISERGRFGSWFKKLYRGDKVPIYSHYEQRLYRILAEINREIAERAAHNEAIIAELRKSDANIQGIAVDRGIGTATSFHVG